MAKSVVKPVATVTWPQVMAWRLQRQYLDKRVAPGEFMAVTSRLCGLHAQLMSSAELTMWARIENLEPARVQQVLWEERSLYKTWAMRGTLHLLPGNEFSLWHSALSAFRHMYRDSWLRYFGVTREELELMIAAIATALDGKLLTRQELAAEVARLTNIPKLGQHMLDNWGSLLKPAAYRGQLCFAPSQGQNVRFTRPASWLAGGGPPDQDGDKAMLEVLRRFLGTYGPASREDFARWWAASSARAAKLLKDLEEELSLIEVAGTQLWHLTEHLADLKEAAPPRVVRLLPAFDQYVIGATLQVNYLTPGNFKDRIYRQQGWISPVLLVDGRMDGIWKQEQKGNRLQVQVEPFVELPEWVKLAAQQEAERLAAFIGGKLEFSIQPSASS